MKFKVFASKYDESNEGWIWMSSLNGINSRDYVSICHGKRKIRCVVRILRKYDIIQYNEGRTKTIEQDDPYVIIMSEFYRDKLGYVETQQEHDLEIKKINVWNVIGKLRAMTGHPDNYVKAAAWLGILSLFLGIIGIVISITGAKP